MNKADILKLAERARINYFIDSDTVVTNLSAIFRFAELVAQHESERIAAEQQRNARANKNSSSIYKVDFGNDERSPGDKYAGCD